MKGLIALGALLLAVGMPAAAAVELEEIHQQFKAAQVKGLDFGTISCDAEIAASKDEAASVDITGSDKDAYTWEASLQGSKLVVKQRSKRTFAKGFDSHCRASVKLPGGLPVKADSVSGQLRISGGFADVDAHSVSGDIRLEAAHGDAKVNTVSGSAKLQDLTGDLDFNSVSGGLDARWSKLPPKGKARIKTVSGDSVLRLPEGQKISVSLKSISGELQNDLPTDPAAGFVVKADAVSGSLAVLKAEARR
jgi:hypothetical protein